MSNEPVHLLAGSTFGGRYRIDRRLRAGGMGAVYVATHLATNKRVALKVMHPEIVADADLRRRFTQEAQVSALVNSRHVVDVTDAGVDDVTGIPFLIMELLDGEDLGEILKRRGPLPFDEALAFLAQAARGLEKAHAAGIVHRDLKPDNLFVCKDEDGAPMVKILDFGIAKLVHATTDRATAAGGTPLYMAPEQMSKGTITHAADLWAFGLITYASLVGRPYWAAESIGELYGELLSGDYPSAVRRAAAQGVALPDAFDAWFARCVVRDPHARMSSVAEAVSALFAVFGRKSIPITRISAPTEVSPPAPAVSAIEATQPSAPSLPTGPTANPVSFTPPMYGPLPGMRSSARRPIEPVAEARAASSPSGRLLAMIAAALFVAAGGGTALYLLRSQDANDPQQFVPPTPATTPAASTEGLPTAVVPPLEGVEQVAAGEAFTCLRSKSSSVDCMGQIHNDIDYPVRRPVSGWGNIVDVAAGVDSVCAVRETGTIECLGNNASGQLGRGPEYIGSDPSPQPIAATKKPTQVTVGNGHACAIWEDATVSCWGATNMGQCGTKVGDDTEGQRVIRLTPVLIAGLSGIRQVAASGGRTCALRKDGRVLCWGAVGGADDVLGSATPKLVPGLEDIERIAVGKSDACAVKKDKQLLCWGTNAYGEHGDETKTAHPMPFLVPEVEDVHDVTIGAARTCVSTTDGVVFCWGSGFSGSMGTGTKVQGESQGPKKLKGVNGIRALSAGFLHTCGVSMDGTVSCWGQNDKHQLGFVSDYTSYCESDTPCAPRPTTVPL